MAGGKAIQKFGIEFLADEDVASARASLKRVKVEPDPDVVELCPGIDTGQANHVQPIVAYDGYWPIKSCPINYGPRWILVKQIMSTQVWSGIYL